MTSSLRTVNDPIARFGDDRLLLDDTTRYGLRRYVVARKGGWPDVKAFLDLATRQAQGAVIHCWVFEDVASGFAYLWICWKSEEERR